MKFFIFIIAFLGFVLCDEYLNSKYSQVNSFTKSWKAGPSKFDNWSLKRIKRLMGVSATHFSELKKFPLLKHKIEYIPDEFDARNQWFNCSTIQEIRDQGSCGSCWAVSAVEVMSDRICIHSQGLYNSHISADDLVGCCDSCGLGCDGGSPMEAWIYFQYNGIVTGGNYNSHQGCKPYTIPSCDHHSNDTLLPCLGEYPTPPCTRTCEKGYEISYIDDKHYGISAYKISSDVAQIQTEIMKNGPVEAVMSVFVDFLGYKSGVYRHVAGKELGSHAIKILGWGTEDGLRYWLVANSWKSDWGENGFFKILRGSNECRIESGIVAGIPKYQNN